MARLHSPGCFMLLSIFDLATTERFVGQCTLKATTDVAMFNANERIIHRFQQTFGSIGMFHCSLLTQILHWKIEKISEANKINFRKKEREFRNGSWSQWGFENKRFSSIPNPSDRRHNRTLNHCLLLAGSWYHIEMFVFHISLCAMIIESTGRNEH